MKLVDDGNGQNYWVHVSSIQRWHASRNEAKIDLRFHRRISTDKLPAPLITRHI